MRLTVRQLKRIISEGVKRVILEARVNHDTSGMDHEGEARYYELWNMLQNNGNYLQQIENGLDPETNVWDDLYVQDVIYGLTEADRGSDEYVVERLAQNIIHDLS